jgi:hypothetical protein
MKNYYKLVLAILSFILFGCSSDDESAEFAMSAKINGTSYRANSPSDDNLFSVDNLFDYYPVEDFVLLQSRTQHFGDRKSIFGSKEPISRSGHIRSGRKLSVRRRRIL